MSFEPNTQRVLIVDDVPANIKVLLPTLSPHYDISIATSGKQALQLADAQKPDLILLDIMMPEMDGYEVCKRLKADEQTKKIPIIFITAKDDESDEMTGLEMGAVDYITKPFSAAIVQARAKTHLGLKLAREEIEKQNSELILAAELREDVNRIMRHDLKTPLNSIIGFSDMLLTDSPYGVDHDSLMEIIRESGYRLLEMINISMDLYKMEQGSYTLEAKPVDIVTVVNKILLACQDRIKSKKLDIHVQILGKIAEDGVSFSVLGEELLCYSMLANLIKNATEASPRREAIKISIGKEESFGMVAIHNMGCVPAEIVPHFFEKYTTAGKSDGTGLGTYSAHLIAKTQKGDIKMETSEESGTTITVLLPLA